ncbi:hypothetical protein ACWGTI_25415 [Mesorhizobium sp. ArgA1]
MPIDVPLSAAGPPLPHVCADEDRLLVAQGNCLFIDTLMRVECG